MLVKDFDAEVDTFLINKIDGEMLRRKRRNLAGIVALGDRKKLVKSTKKLLKMKECTDATSLSYQKIANRLEASGCSTINQCG